MTAGDAAHAITITVDEPGEVPVGADFALTVLVSCPAGCDLSGVPIEVTAPDGVRTTIEPHPPYPPPHGGESREGGADIAGARRVALRAPLVAGEHVWRLCCPADDGGG